MESHKKCTLNSRNLSPQTSSGVIKSPISSRYSHIVNKNLERARIRKQSLFKTQQKKPATKSSLYSVMSSFYICRKFVQNLLNLAALRKPKWLTAYHFDIMDDKAFSYTQYKRVLMLENSNCQDLAIQRSVSTIKYSSKISDMFGLGNFSLMSKEKIEKIRLFFKKIKKFCLRQNICKYLDKYTQIYDPTKPLIILWDLIILLVILFFFIQIPIELTFTSSSSDKIMIWKEIGCIVLLLDIMKTFNTAYYDKGVLVINRREVFSKYIHGSFIFDILSIFPLIWNYQMCTMSISNYLNLIFFLKYSNFKKILQRFEELLFLDQNILALGKMIFRMLFVSHIFACFWFFVGSVSDPRNNWIIKANLQDAQWTSQYLRSFYFIIVTVNTVGFGDITPINDWEVLTIIIFIFIGCGLFAMNLNSIGVILANLSKKTNECSKELNIINQFMLEKNVNFDLRMKIRKYLQYIRNEENLEGIEHQAQIINKLSDSLKDELLLEANGPIIRDIKLFNLNFSEETLRQTIGIMKEMRFTPGDMIFHQDDIQDKSIFIIKKGYVEIFYDNPDIHSVEKNIKKLGPGEIFGELAFFSNKERTSCARSNDFTNIFAIKQEDFLGIIEKNKKDIERFCQIRDNINIYEDFEDLYSKCYSCQEASHQVQNCPLVHYTPKREIILLKFLHTSPQARNQIFIRYHKKRMNALRSLTKIEQNAFKFQETIFPSHESGSEEDNKDNLNKSFECNKSPKISTFGDSQNKETLINIDLGSYKGAKISSFGDSQNKDTLNDLTTNKTPKLSSFGDPQRRDSLINNDNNDNNDINDNNNNNDNYNNDQITNKLPKLSLFGDAQNKETSMSNDPESKVFQFLSEIEENKSSDDSSQNDESPSKIRKRYLRQKSRKNGLIRSKTSKTEENKTSLINEKSENFDEEKKNEQKKSQILMVNFEENCLKNNCALEIDRIKSFEFYFPENNIEKILARIEYVKLSEFLQKTKKNKNKKKYQRFLENRMNLNDKKPDFLIGSSLQQNAFDAQKYLEQFDGETIKKVSLEKSNKIQKSFFKKKSQIQKMILDEEFDQEKFKEKFKESYNVKKKTTFFEKVLKVFRKKIQPKMKTMRSKTLKSQKV